MQKIVDLNNEGHKKIEKSAETEENEKIDTDKSIQIITKMNTKLTGFWKATEQEQIIVDTESSVTTLPKRKWSPVTKSKEEQENITD